MATTTQRTKSIRVAVVAALATATATLGIIPSAHAFTHFSQSAISASTQTLVEQAGFGRSIGLRRAIQRGIVDGRNGYTTSVIGNNQVRVKHPRELRAEKKAAEENAAVETTNKQGLKARRFSQRKLIEIPSSGLGYGVSAR